MGVLHDRELLIRSLWPILALGLAPLACGGNAGDPAPDPPAPVDTAPADAEPLTLAPVPEGEPMPAAEDAGGIPPYPRAVVHIRMPRENPDMRTLEAFTPDPYETVVAFYDSALAGWSKIRDVDVVVYDAGGDRAAVTVSPWEAEQLPAGSPPALTEARTAIGAAWRP